MRHCSQQQSITVYLNRLLIVSLLLIAKKAYSWNRSTIECFGANYFHIACVLSDVVLYKGELFYIVEGSTPSIPSVRISEWAGFPWHEDESQDSKQLPELHQFVNMVSESEMRDIVNAQAVVEQFIFAQLIQPQWQTLDAWWHTVDDAMSWFFRWCWQLGVCEYDRKIAEHSAFVWIYRLFDLTAKLESMREANDAQLDVLNCYATTVLRLCDKPSGAQKTSEADYPEDKVYVFHKLVAGTGNSTAHVFHYQELRQLEPPPAERMKAISFFRKCAGLESHPPVPPSPQPRVMLMNRPYHKGRSILNMDFIYNLMLKTYPQFDISLKMMDVLTFPEQAAAFNGADVVLLPHGAATINLHFLPQVASVVDVNSWEGHAKHQTKVIEKLPAPVYHVSQFQMMLPATRLEGMTGKMKEAPDLRDPRKSCDDKLYFMRQGFTSPLYNGGISNYFPDPDEVMEQLANAIQAWRRDYICVVQGQCPKESMISVNL